MIDAQLLQQAVIASDDGIVIADAQQPDLPLIYVNPAFERLTGYSSAEAINRNCRFLQGKESNQPGLDALRTALCNSEPCRVKLHNYRKDGSAFWNELSLTPVRNAEGQVTHFIGIQQDITARVIAEQQLHDREQALEIANVQLQALDIRDQLTGLFSRRFFDQQFQREWRLACRLGVSLSLLILDIDFFSAYNDAYGRPAGDDCLRQIAKALQHSFLRASDTVARYEGEKFVVLVVGQEEFCLEQQVHLLQTRLAELAIPHAKSPVAQCLTLSGGLATMPADVILKPDELLTMADAALRKAKTQGRNRVECATGLPDVP